MTTNFSRLSRIEKIFCWLAFAALALMVWCRADTNAPPATNAVPAPAIVPRVFDEDTMWQAQTIFHTHADTNGVRVTSRLWPVVAQTNGGWLVTFSTNTPPSPAPSAPPKPAEPTFIDGVRYGVAARVRNPDVDDVGQIASIAYRFWQSQQPKQEPIKLQSVEAAKK